MDIRLRPAVYGDLVRIGHVAGRAFFDDNILGDMVHPHKGQFPNDMDLYWSRRARVNFWDYRWKQVVATCHDDKGNDVVVGIAQCMLQDPRHLSQGPCRRTSLANEPSRGAIWPWRKRSRTFAVRSS